ncbi:penicillin-binding protein 2 [Candidatus Parcubacteria bacterium]|nr:penicillin-binding protein 2 [Candidatus Parcubacteria bacterium]
MRAQFRSRIRLILVFFILAALGIILRLYFVQIVHGEEYSLKADHQFSSISSGLFDRGSIYFTRKDGTLISAATLATGFLVAINPQLLGDPEAAYAAIAAVASSTVIAHDAFIAAAARKSQIYIEVAHHLSGEEGSTLAAENIPGVEVLRERWPIYPGGDLASQTIGVVSYGSGGTLTGQTGLEAQYDQTLSRPGNGLYQNFFAELFSNAGNLLMSANNAREGNVITSIEPEVETRLVDDLAKVNKRYSSQATGGIIMDPKTGAIIALASYPTLDLNDLASANPALLTNPLVGYVYEFGSIMKPLTMAAGLDAGVITPQTTYDDTGCITVDKAKICNYDHKARGVIPMMQIIKQSLNVGASWVATQLGQDKFRNYFLKYFGQKTGIDLPSETDALLSNLSKPEQINYDTAAFGQGIAVTPVQMIRALGAIPNGGVMMTPHVATGIQLDTGIIRPLNFPAPVPVFSAQAAQEVTDMLTHVFPADAKLAMRADPSLRMPDVTVASKTGTAQVEKPGGGYYGNIFFHSFYGFFPADNPRFVILLYTNRPQGVEYASASLTPTFMDLTDFLINYYHIPPQQN